MLTHNLKEDLQTQLSIVDSSQLPHPQLSTISSHTTLTDLMKFIEDESQMFKTANFHPPSCVSSIKSRKWSQTQTYKFYYLLCQLGPDFTCMSIHQLFAGRRCKKQLRNKFRKEQRLKMQIIEICLDRFYQLGKEGIKQ